MMIEDLFLLLIVEAWKLGARALHCFADAIQYVWTAPESLKAGRYLAYAA